MKKILEVLLLTESGYQDCRFSAEQVNLKVEGDTTQDFKVGNIRIDVKARGRR